MIKNKFGYVAIIGKPNVGKSTLLNRLIGENLAIVSPKPQTTREHIKAILNLSGVQIVFTDTPGIHKPRHMLGQYMIEEARAVLLESDLLIWVLDVQNIDEDDERVFEWIKENKKPCIFVLNKIDRVQKAQIIPILDRWSKRYEFLAYIPVSAIKRQGIDKVLNEVVEFLPEGPALYDKEQITDRSQRFFVSEYVRQEALNLLYQEVPHNVAVVVEQMKDRKEGIQYIRANIIVEKDTQKAILIGKQGGMLKQIGSRARSKIERFLEKKVFLDLWVKVKKNWRNDRLFLQYMKEMHGVWEV